MKPIILTVLLLSVCLFSQAQNYQPFNRNVPKRFASVTTPSDNEYFFYAHYDTLIGSDLVLRQYTISNENTPAVATPACPGWGNPVHGADTSWLGLNITYDTVSSQLNLQNDQNEPFDFDLGMTLGDSSVFYSNATDAYYIRFDSQQEEIVLGQADTVKTFTILHYDLGGQPVNSASNGFGIKVGKELGVIQFIDVFHFPALESGFQLIGQLNPFFGEYQLMYTDAFPWQPGDLIEYSANKSPGMAGGQYTQWYELYEVTDRIETTDSVKIAFAITTMVTQSGPPVSTPDLFYYGDTLRFSKQDCVSVIPFNSIPYDDYYRWSLPIDHCGMRTQFTFQHDFVYYCDTCNCMVPYDGFGDFSEVLRFEEGFGITYQNFQEYGPINTSPTTTKSQIYTKINGVECGQIIYLGIGKEEQLSISVYPNPSHGLITIESDHPETNLSLCTLDGKVVIDSFHTDSPKTQLDLSFLKKGVYLLTSGSGHTKRILIN